MSCIAISVLLTGCASATAAPTSADAVDQSVFSGATATPKASPVSHSIPNQSGAAAIAIGQTTGNQQPNSQSHVPVKTNPVPAQQLAQQPTSAPPTQAPAQSTVPTPTPTPAATPAPTSTPTQTPTATPVATTTPTWDMARIRSWDSHMSCSSRKILIICNII